MKNAPVIIVKKKKGHGHGHHGGAWKVAYADFVTAMMAFFLVMWIVGLNKPMRQAIAHYFKHPSVFTTGGAAMPLGSGDPSPDKHAVVVIPDMEKMKAVLQAKSDAILQDLKKNPEFNSVKDSVEAHLTNEGLRIELIEKKSSLFFATGSAKLNPRTVRVLQLIAN